MNRIEEFSQDGKNIMLFDFSGFTTDKEYTDLISSAKMLIMKYEPDSLYTVTNMKGAVVSAKTHDIIADWVKYNKPYVKHGVVYGVDAAQKVIGQTAAVVTQRTNLVYVSTKEDAMEHIKNL